MKLLFFVVFASQFGYPNYKDDYSVYYFSVLNQGSKKVCLFFNKNYPSNFYFVDGKKVTQVDTTKKEKTLLGEDHPGYDKAVFASHVFLGMLDGGIFKDSLNIDSVYGNSMKMTQNRLEDETFFVSEAPNPHNKKEIIVSKLDFKKDRVVNLEIEDTIQYKTVQDNGIMIKPFKLSNKFDLKKYDLGFKKKYPYHIVQFGFSKCVPCVAENKFLKSKLKSNINFEVFQLNPANYKKLIDDLNEDDVAHYKPFKLEKGDRIMTYPATYIYDNKGNLIHQMTGYNQEILNSVIDSLSTIQ